MITLFRANERHHDRRKKADAWFTFDPWNHIDPSAGGFGALESLVEKRLPPGEGESRLPHHEGEIVTYVREGALAYEDSMGRSSVIHAGEFHHLTAGRRLRQSEANVSRTDGAHVFHIYLRAPMAGVEPSREQRRFYAAERRGVLCVVASPDGRGGSLRLHQDVSIYSSTLETGHHVVHEILQGRCAWLHLVRGEATLGDVVLTGGDGAGVTAEHAVSLTARDETEILLLDLDRSVLPPARQAGGVN